jgi:hypothetical protein
MVDKIENKNNGITKLSFCSENASNNPVIAAAKSKPRSDI